MRCQEIRNLLSDYVDDELSSGPERSVEGHLDDCEDCRQELEALTSLLESAGSLELGIEPERDLWSGIEERLRLPDPEEARGRWRSVSWVGLAAAAVLVLAVALQFSQRPSTPAPPPSSEVAMLDPSYIRVSEEVRARNGLLQLRSDLLRAIGERRDSLDPETRAVLDRNLLLIDQAIAEIHEALQENPDNRGLEFLLAATYQREVEFLKNMNLL